MKLWVDDERPAPEGWTWVKTVDEATQALTDNEVTDLSLTPKDRDVWEDGAMVLGWLRNHPDRYPSATVVPHSGSASGYDLLERCIADTERWVREYREIVGSPAWHLAEAMCDEEPHSDTPWCRIGVYRQMERARAAKRVLERLDNLPYRWAGPEGSPTDASGSMLTAFSGGEAEA